MLKAKNAEGIKLNSEYLLIKQDKYNKRSSFSDAFFINRTNTTKKIMIIKFQY